MDCNFGDLKAGDKFRWQGDEYEKIAGNTAVLIITDEVVEFHDVLVTLIEEW